MAIQDVFDKIMRELDEDPSIIEDFRKKLENKEKDSIRKREKIDRFISTLTKDELESFLFDKYISWEKSYQHKFLMKGIESNSNILYAIVEYIKYYGNEIELNEDFFSFGYTLGDYQLVCYVGQGSFYRLSYKGENILST